MNDVADILLVEDDSDFAFLLQAACEYAGIPNSVKVLDNSSAALEFLAHAKPCKLPALVLLDLRLPQSSGLDVLRWVRRQPNLQNLPVVILTGTEIESEVQLARSLGANGFLLKPFQFHELVALVENLRAQWLTPVSPTSVAA
jgi:DNA-binding response OmpR family regulator